MTRRKEKNGMTNRQWVLLALLVGLPGMMAFVLALGLMAYFTLDGPPPPPTFEVRDPNSPTVIRITGSNCVISADGRRDTQYAGWPKDQIAEGAEPTGVVFHSNPDWVEITLSSGERLRLSWDTAAAERARASRDGHYFLKPRYEVLPAP